MESLLLAFAAPFTDPASRTWWVGLVLAAAFALAIHRGIPKGILQQWTSRSSRLDMQLLLARNLIGLLWVPTGIALAFGLATRGVIALDTYLGTPSFGGSPAVVMAVYTTTLFVAWDASRYVLHRLLHGVPVLWAFHQVHHSATVLTPLTFHRVHPVETALYRIRGVVVTGGVTAVFFWLFRDAAVQWSLVGVHGIGLIFNVVTGNLRHSHTWWRFPTCVERWLISPAQHQLHHALDPEYHHSNYGTWLAIWDRWAGTLRLAGPRPPQRYGISERNHEDHLLSAWFSPIRDAMGKVWTLLLLLPTLASAQDFGEVFEQDEPSLEVIVYAEDGVPRVAGSAHQVDERELERFEYDDVQRVLSKIPGVYVRGEDGYGLRPNIGIRGANSDRSAKITLLEDGVPLAPAPYAASAAYYFPMATRAVGIEVFKGPSATLHGPHTVGGAVNFRTRPVPEAPVGQFDFALGLRSATKMHVYGGTGSNRAGVLVEAAHVATSGFKELDSGEPTGFRRADVMLKGRLRSDPTRTHEHGLELKLGYGNERSNETYLGLSSDDYADNPYRRYAASEGARMRWHRTQAELAWPVRLGEAFEVRTVAYHHYLTRQWTKFNRFANGPDLHDLLQGPDSGRSSVFLAILRGEEDTSSSDQTLLIGTNDRAFHSFGLQTRAVHEQRTGRVSNRVQFGARVHADVVDRLHTEDPHAMVLGGLVPLDGPALTPLDSHATATALSAYAHDDFQFGRLHLLPSGRFEGIRTTRADVGVEPNAPQLRTALLPGIAILGELATAFHLFGGAHQGFSPVAPGSGPDVRPERSWNYEAGLRAGQSGTPLVELVGYLNDYLNITGQCTFSGGCTGNQLDEQFNGGKAWVYGLEAGASHELLLPHRLTLPIAFNYTWTESAFRTTFVSGFPQYGSVRAGDALPYVPRHQGSARVSLDHARFSLSAGAVARSGMLDAAGLYPVTDSDVPALFLLDLAGSAKISDKLQLYTTLTNATASKAPVSWRPFGARPTAPLQWMAGLKLDAF